MIKQNDFLIEIGTEELPPKMLQQLVDALANGISKRLTTEELGFKKLYTYATPRRLAVLIEKLHSQQPARSIERRGPALRAAYDEQGKPTPALLGFARSCNTNPANLEKLETPQGSWLIYRSSEAGKTVKELLPTIINQALAELPIAKPMRWADLDIQFVRPVHWIVMLYGNTIIPANILGLPSSRLTFGHRVHHPRPIPLATASSYAKTLKTKGHVIADFAERRDMIRKQISKITARSKGKAEINADLLDEVTGLVEWPVALLAEFDKTFLKLPKEALTTAMQHHQKCFPIVDAKKQLLPQFITISNLASKNKKEVMTGNERVMRARLSDAQFFYTTDCKQTLNDRLPALQHVIFQAKLGNLLAKSKRLAALATYIAPLIHGETDHAARAALLAKTDLVTAMVNEFPELQGVMGYYYALHDKEDKSVAIAIREHYLPRFAGDVLPQSKAGCILALADRIDNIVGIFGINQQPTSDKDPFGLRRAALGILRILIEQNLALNLQTSLEHAYHNYAPPLENSHAASQAFDFILERLRAWYQEQHITPDVFAAVFARRPTVPADFDARIKAVSAFRQLTQAPALIAANKRVSNLLLKEGQQNIDGDVRSELLTETAEKTLAAQIKQKTKIVVPLYQKQDYVAALTELAALQKDVDQFFDTVMVMVDDTNIRNNRLRLLAQLRGLFLNTADISLLQ